MYEGKDYITWETPDMDYATECYVEYEKHPNYLSQASEDQAAGVAAFLAILNFEDEQRRRFNGGLDHDEAFYRVECAAESATEEITPGTQLSKYDVMDKARRIALDCYKDCYSGWNDYAPYRFRPYPAIGDKIFTISTRVREHTSACYHKYMETPQKCSLNDLAGAAALIGMKDFEEEQRTDRKTHSHSTARSMIPSFAKKAAEKLVASGLEALRKNPPKAREEGCPLTDRGELLGCSYIIVAKAEKEALDYYNEFYGKDWQYEPTKILDESISHNFPSKAWWYPKR